MNDDITELLDSYEREAIAFGKGLTRGLTLVLIRSAIEREIAKLREATVRS